MQGHDGHEVCTTTACAKAIAVAHRKGMHCELRGSSWSL